MTPLAPGAMIGILGGGQLGRMTALAARRMGFQVAVYDPAPDGPAFCVADHAVNAPWDDLDALGAFAEAVDVATFEFENIPRASVQTVAERRPLHPGWHVLEICQNRGLERGFLQKNGFPQPDYALVDSPDTLADALERLGRPAVLKTIAFGYDGKGQRVIRDGEDATAAWREWGGSSGIVETFIDFECELSVVCSRTPDGTTATLPVPENIHTNGILDISIAPGRFPDAVANEARSLAIAVMDALDATGMLAIEMFLEKNGGLRVNELAPRPHNSGHFSFDACLTSQFEQHARTVCNLPPGNTRLLSPCVMVNLLGNLWQQGVPNWRHILDNPQAKLHLYGKQNARPGRKMGHFCVLNPSLNQAMDAALAIQKTLQLDIPPKSSSYS